jgi:hypothetical protein
MKPMATEWPGLKGHRTQPRARWRSHRRPGFAQTPPFPKASRPEWAREGVCRAQGDHARRSPIRHLSRAPSQRGLGRGGASSPKPRACSFLAAPWADSCGPLAHDALHWITRSYTSTTVAFAAVYVIASFVGMVIIFSVLLEVSQLRPFLWPWREWRGLLRL